MSTAAEAHGRWPAILQALGVDPKYLRNIHGPCPVCAGRDRFRFDDEYNGKWFCSHCGSGDGFALLQKLHGWDFKRAAAEVDKVIGRCPITTEAKPERTEADKQGFLRKLFLESRPVSQGDPVWRYLQMRCGNPTGLLDDIRYHPALKHSVSGKEHPAMLAVMRGVDGSKGIGIHRTYLTFDGKKANVDPVRMALGEMGTIRLGPLQERIGIAEGIETAICASKRFSLPVWSVVCANGMKDWQVPEGVKIVAIFGDNDETYTGQEAAFVLAKRLKMAGISTAVKIPGKTGTDWADVVMEGVV